MLIKSKYNGVKVIPVSVHPHAPKSHQDLAKSLKPMRDTITLLPGINEVTSDEWEFMKLHLESEIENGDVTVVSIKTAVGKDKPAHLVETIRDVDAKRAVSLVKEAANPETLQRWFVEETRDEVRAVLKERMDELHVQRLTPEQLEALTKPGVAPVTDLLTKGNPNKSKPHENGEDTDDTDEGDEPNTDDEDDNTDDEDDNNADQGDESSKDDKPDNKAPSKAPGKNGNGKGK